MKEKTLKVVKWDMSKEISLSTPKQKVSRSLMEHAESLGIVGAPFLIEGISECVYFTKKSINESIANTVKKRGNLGDLAKLFTVLDKIITNAILLEKEEYRHKSRTQAKHIDAMYQYVSAFCDDYWLYPVKITVEKRKDAGQNRFYIVLSVGKIILSDVKEKETIPVAGVHSYEESLHNGAVSYEISITHLIKHFNKKQDIILKNVPDELLNDEQRMIKAKVIEKDLQKEGFATKITMFLM